MGTSLVSEDGRLYMQNGGEVRAVGAVSDLFDTPWHTCRGRKYASAAAHARRKTTTFLNLVKSG